MSFITDKIYPKLPVFIQNIGISVYGYNWKKRRLGGVFEEELKKSKSREYFDFDQWHNYQTTELRKILCHAFETVPFYREKYSKEGFTLNDFKTFKLEDLYKLPFLEKQELRNFGNTKLLSSKVEKGRAFFHSSGSTGTPTKICYSHKMHQSFTAIFENRVRNWAGVNYKNARAMIGGRRILPEGNAIPPYYRYNFFEKQVYMSAYHISRETAYNYLEGIKKYGVEYMTGYAMSNFFLARFIHEENLQAPKLKAVMTSSEKLTPQMREMFKKVYGCHTYDAWSGLENCALISECDHHSLHLSPDVGIAEVLNSDMKPVAAGETGEIICTGFINYDQPLIRYRIGDMVKKSNTDQCSCGRNMPVFDEIMGRTEDTVIGKDGREMVRFHGVFIDLPNVLEGQIEQLDYDDFAVNIVTNGKLSAEESTTIKNRLESQLGSINLKINEIDNIPKNANGKFKAVISHLKRNNN